MIELNGGINPTLQDATFDIDGTASKLNNLEAVIEYQSMRGEFAPLPQEIITAKQAWKEDNTEEKYVAHMNELVRFFIDQIEGKSVDQLAEAAHAVAAEQNHRRWNIIAAIMSSLKESHNIIAVSLMPEQLMEPLTRDLGFVALIGSSYIEQDGIYTGEAYGINKAAEYTKLRNSDISKLDIHVGDTIGDSSLFDIAARPILFNPSHTLYSQVSSGNRTVLTSHKDVVTVMNPTDTPHQRIATIWGPPFDVDAILEQVIRVR